MTTPSIELMFKQSFDSIMELAGGLPDYSVEYQVEGFAAHILAAHILAAMQSARKKQDRSIVRHTVSHAISETKEQEIYKMSGLVTILQGDWVECLSAIPSGWIHC